jgi:hypothetical protein
MFSVGYTYLLPPRLGVAQKQKNPYPNGEKGKDFIKCSTTEGKGAPIT